MKLLDFGTPAADIQTLASQLPMALSCQDTLCVDCHLSGVEMGSTRTIQEPRPFWYGAG